MNAPLAASLVTEMLDHVRDVDIAPLDPGLLEPLVEDAAGRPDERMALDVLAVARLLADHHHLGVPGPFAHHGLGRSLPKVAGPAGLYRVVQCLEARLVRNRGGGAIELRRGLSAQGGHFASGVPEP